MYSIKLYIRIIFILRNQPLYLSFRYAIIYSGTTSLMSFDMSCVAKVFKTRDRLPYHIDTLISYNGNIYCIDCCVLLACVITLGPIE